MKKNKLVFFYLLFVMFSCQTFKNNSVFLKQKYTHLKVVNNKNYLSSKNKVKTKIKDNFIKQKFHKIDKISNKNCLKDSVSTLVLEKDKKLNLKSKPFTSKNIIKKLTYFYSKQYITNKIKAKQIPASKKEYNLLLLVVLCFIIPFLAVGLKTNWDLVKVIIAFLLWPTIIFSILFALLVVYDILEF